MNVIVSDSWYTGIVSSTIFKQVSPESVVLSSETVPVLGRCAGDFGEMREAKKVWKLFVMTRKRSMTTSAWKAVQAECKTHILGARMISIVTATILSTSPFSNNNAMVVQLLVTVYDDICFGSDVKYPSLSIPCARRCTSWVWSWSSASFQSSMWENGPSPWDMWTFKGHLELSISGGSGIFETLSSKFHKSKSWEPTVRCPEREGTCKIMLIIISTLKDEGACNILRIVISTLK